MIMILQWTCLRQVFPLHMNVANTKQTKFTHNFLSQAQLWLRLERRRSGYREYLFSEKKYLSHSEEPWRLNKYLITAIILVFNAD